MHNAPKNWPPSSTPESLKPEDIEEGLEEMGGELLSYFRRLPKELWARHYRTLLAMAEEHSEEMNLAKERESYMEVVLEGREQAIVEYSASDAKLREAWAAVETTQETLTGMLREIFFEQGNLLGAGRTARVKRARITGLDTPLAIKYLLTPTSQTLSVNAEHDMLREVETITQIEEVENRLGVGNRIGVPHPYFFYKRGKLQCYGMSEVKGVDIETLLKGADAGILLQDSVMKALRTRYATEEAREALYKEAEDFVTAMHEVCLHGDIKDKNFMVDVEGKFHLIDFGQSVQANKEDETTRDQFDNLKDEERRATLDRIRNLLNVASATERQAA